MKAKLILICFLCLTVLTPIKVQAADTGNGLFAEYFQYRNAEYPFSATTKRYEMTNDVVDKVWKNNPYSVTTSNGNVSFNQLSVTTLSTKVAQTKVKYLSNNRMAVRWSGRIKVSTARTVKFRIRGNGGAYFLLRDGKTYVHADNWKDNFLGNLTGTTATILTTGSKKLLAETYYPVVIEYMNYDGNANILLQWSTDGGVTWKNVPKNVLYSSTATHRSVSIKTLDEAGLSAVKRAATNLQKQIDKNYLKDQLVNVAQDAAIDMLGPRTKTLIAMGTQVLTKSYTDAVLLTIGKKVLGSVAIPFTTAYDFMSIFKQVIYAADDATKSDSVRAIVYLTSKEFLVDPVTALPDGIEIIHKTHVFLDYGDIKLSEYDKVANHILLNVGKLANTLDDNQRKEFILLTMSAILESYVFQYHLLNLVAK